jgi:biopolymer transport protein ExbD
VNGRPLINNSPVTLAAAIGKAAANNRAVPVTIRADARAMHQSVVTAMDVAGQAGYRQINIATVHDGQQAR